MRLSLPEDNPCELFHTDTKLYPYQLRQWKYQQQPIAEHPAIARWMQAPFKEYLSLPQVDLPTPLPLKKIYEAKKMPKKRRMRSIFPRSSIIQTK
ncbi:MAG: hypothetical protein D3905_16895 [Candidatus Electrothrix sp. AS4_5]|nr:hypothetical protein [Candidatus Electrothrix gigas]